LLSSFDNRFRPARTRAAETGGYGGYIKDPDELRDEILALAEAEVVEIPEARRRAGKCKVIGWQGQTRPRVAGVAPDA
jgi:hypothetical protein